MHNPVYEPEDIPCTEDDEDDYKDDSQYDTPTNTTSSTPSITQHTVRLR